MARRVGQGIDRLVEREGRVAAAGRLAGMPLGVGDLLHSLLFSSARVVPERLEAAGFTFAHTDLDEALRSVLSGG